MELLQYIEKIRDAIDQAYRTLENTLMERDTALEELKKQIDMLSKDGYNQKYTEIIAKFNAAVAELKANYEKVRDEQKAAYMAEVKAYYTPDGSKIDQNDSAVLNSGITLSVDELADMIMKYTDNVTMIRVIHNYIMRMRINIERMKPDTLNLIHKVTKKTPGETENRILNTFINLAAGGLNHPDESYTHYWKGLDDYLKDSELALLKAKMYIDQDTKAAIDSLEVEIMEKNNDVHSKRTSKAYQQQTIIKPANDRHLWGN